MSSTRNFALAASAAVLVLASCKGAEQVCNPTDPLCGGAGGITAIAVTSAIDTVIANGRTAQMTAVASNASGNVSVTFGWTSLNPSVATVNPSSGLVTAVGTGTATIRASQSTNTVVGNLQLRVVNANLALVTAAVTDSMAVRLRNALGAVPQGAVTTGLTTCATHVVSGNLLALNTCLTSLIALGPPPIDNHDKVVLGILDVFFDFARRQLNL